MKTPEDLAEGHVEKIWQDTGTEFERICCHQDFLAGYQAAAPQWISVKDRLPEINVDVLIIYGRLPFYHLAFLTHNGDIQFFWGNYSNIEYSLDDVTHWMPLPKPPEE